MPERVAVERKGGVEIIHRVDGMRERLRRRRSRSGRLTRDANCGHKRDGRQNQTGDEFLHGVYFFPAASLAASFASACAEAVAAALRSTAAPRIRVRDICMQLHG